MRRACCRWFRGKLHGEIKSNIEFCSQSSAAISSRVNLGRKLHVPDCAQFVRGSFKFIDELAEALNNFCRFREEFWIPKQRMYLEISAGAGVELRDVLVRNVLELLCNL